MESRVETEGEEEEEGEALKGVLLKDHWYSLAFSEGESAGIASSPTGTAAAAFSSNQGDTAAKGFHIHKQHR